MPTIYEEYLEASATYQAKYGKKTLVLMEVGSFFEIYAIRNEQEQAGPDIAAVCDILNLQLSRKNKSILENHRSNPLMAGFPSHTLHKHAQTLLQHQYTVVLIRQTTPPPNPKREVTDIWSPSMQLQPTGSESNFLMVVYADVCPDAYGRRLYALGCAGMDVSTGETWVLEAASTAQDPHRALDELHRCDHTFRPKEVVILGSPEMTDDDIVLWENLLGISYDTGRLVHKRWRDPEVLMYQKIGYQNAVLQKAFPGLGGMIQPVESLHLERKAEARMALMYMIQFAFEHSQLWVKELKRPWHVGVDGDCTPENNCALQLQVISYQSHEKPLLSWLNRCATAFGARRYTERLLHPTSRVDVLERSYAQIDHYLEDRRYESVHGALRGISDLERMLRRMTFGNFSPMEWCGLQSSLEHAIEAGTYADKTPLIGLAQQLLAGFQDVLLLDECAKVLSKDIRMNVFVKGVHPEIDRIQEDEYARPWNELKRLAEYLEQKGADACRVESNERDGYSLILTKKRWQNVFQQLPACLQAEEMGATEPLDTSLFQPRLVSAQSSLLRLHHPWIEQRSHTIQRAFSRLAAHVTHAYTAFVARYAETYRGRWLQLIEQIAQLDVAVTHAKNACEYRLCRPQLVDPEGQGGSSVVAQDMRHPILERVMDTTLYVPNHVALGCGQPHQGCLLFGINASGKSSLMKAVGLNVLMAQSGGFVAAREMTLAPYRHIFTRIAGTDNIYKGWSTFTVEMMELNNILRRADAYSLVLGDELCAGTESISALAIVSAGIEHLHARKTSFIFATHLHDLAARPRIQALSRLQMAHMHVEIDAQGRILYDRRMREGCGHTLYGLEVCRGLGLPAEFLRVAHEVRCELEGISPKLQDPSVSRYNARLFVQECRVCGGSATETHHIHEQRHADADGMIGTFHKDRAFNLVPLCERCHQQAHHGDLHIRGYVQTTAGPILDFKTACSESAEETVPQEGRSVEGGREEKGMQRILREVAWDRVRYHHHWYVRPRTRWRKATWEEAYAWICKHWKKEPGTRLPTVHELQTWGHYILLDPTIG